MHTPSTTVAEPGTWLARWARRNPLLVFFAVAYLFGWIGFLPLVLTNPGLGIIHANVPIEIIAVGAFAPTVAALCTQWLLERNFRICHFSTSWQKLLLGFVTGLAVIMIGFVILPSLALVKASPRSLHWSALWTPAAYAMNWTTFLGGPINEEPGWRGFALPRLQMRFGPVLGSVVLGVLWAGWHLPLFLIHFVNIPAWAFVIVMVDVSILLTWGANLSSLNILVPMLMHAAFNTSSRLLAAMCAGVPTRARELLFYLCAASAATWVVVLVTGGRLGLSKRRHSVG